MSGPGPAAPAHRAGATRGRGRPAVLVLDGHSKAAAEAVLALPAACELHVAATRAGSLAFASGRVARRLIQPEDPAGLAAWIEALDREHGYRLILPSTEASLVALKPMRLDPALRARAVLAEEASIDIALSKDDTMRVAAGLGIRVPAARLVESAAQAGEARLPFPLVIKPVRSKVAIEGRLLSLSAVVCADAAQRAAALRDLLPRTPVLEQEYFAGRGVGVEVLFEHGRLRWIFAHERLHEMPVTGGASTYRRACDPPPAVRDAAVALMEHLRWHGVAMVEFKVSPDRRDYRLIEINPRLWGSLPLAVAAGVNFPLGLYRLANGESPGPQPRPTRCRYMRDAAADVRWFVQSWKQRHDPLRIKPLQAADFAAWLRPLWGRERWDLFRLREWSLWWASSRHLVEGPATRWAAWRARRRALAASRAGWRRLGADWRAGRIERVLVLCYGNICRSPVVAALLSAALPGLEVRSTGMHPRTGRSSPPEWAETARDVLAVDLAPHRSRLAGEDDLAWAQLIIAMDAANWQAVGERHPQHLARTILLPVMAGLRGAGEVADPYGRPPAEMRAIAARIGACVDALAASSPRRGERPR